MSGWLPTIHDKLTSEITIVPDSLKPRHLPGLDGLRGISILIVIFAHFIRDTSLNALFIGGVGVDIFFVISGFLITTLLLKEKVSKGKVSLTRFYIRRLLRIVPVAYLFITGLIILNYIYNLKITTKSFITAALYLKNVPFKQAGDWYTGHFWSLSVEEQYYLIFPALLVYKSNRYIYLISFAILVIPMLLLFGFNDIGTLQANHLIHFITFALINIFGKGTISILIGSLTSVLIFKKIIIVEKFKYSYWLSFILFIIGVVLHIFARDAYIGPIVFALIIAFVIINTLSQRSFLYKLLETKPLVYIGTISYSLYIWQQLFTASQPWLNHFSFSNSVVFNLSVLFIVATASYYLYELRFLKLKKHFQ